MITCKAKVFHGSPFDVEGELNAFLDWLYKQDQAEPLTILQSQDTTNGTTRVVITVLYHIDDGKDKISEPGYAEEVGPGGRR